MTGETNRDFEYGEFFRTSSDLMSIFGLDGRLVAFNPAWRELLGWEISELESTPFIEFVHPDDRERTLGELAILSSTENARTGFENRQRCRDGSYKWFEWNSQRRGQLVYAIGRDVTRRLATFAALDESTETMRAILDAAADSIIVVNRNLMIVDSSRSGEQIYGYPLGGYRGRNVLEIVHPDDRAAVEEAIAGTFAADGIRVVGFRAGHADGHWVDIEARGQALRSADGVAKMAVFISRDVSETAAWQRALANSFATTQAIVDTAVDVITTIDRDFRVVDTSQASEGVTGIPASQRRGQDVAAIIHPDDQSRVLAAARDMFDKGARFNIRYRARSLNGTWITVESRGRTIDHVDGPPVHAVVITRDVTANVQMEEALEAARWEAERANSAKSEFLSRMSHELRTPLNSVLGFAQILQLELESPRQLEMAELIVWSGSHLLELINEVLDISRVESNTIEVVLESVDLAQLIRGCIDLVAPLAISRHVTISTVEQSESKVFADSKRLNQILINLLSNAIKYNREGGQVRVSCEIRDGRVRLAVSDSGPGIAPDLRERLFTPFDRLGAEGTETEGTGLGLALAKTFAEAMNTTLDYSSVEGEGSTFWVDLPMDNGDPDENITA